MKWETDPVSIWFIILELCLIRCPWTVNNNINLTNLSRDPKLP